MACSANWELLDLPKSVLQDVGKGKPCPEG